MLRLLILVACIAAPCAAYAAVPGSVETWDAGLNGWQQSTTSSTVSHSDTDGNPDGHVTIRKALGGFDSVGISTESSADYLGDFSGVIGISVDAIYRTNDVNGAWIRFRPDGVDNGWRYSLTNVFPTDTWTTYQAPFDPGWDDATAVLNGWEKFDPAAGSFADLFSSVGWAEVRFNSPQTSTIIGVDNFRLIAIPEPSTVCLVAASLITLVTADRRRLRS